MIERLRGYFIVLCVLVKGLSHIIAVSIGGVAFYLDSKQLKYGFAMIVESTQCHRFAIAQFALRPPFCNLLEC